MPPKSQWFAMYAIILTLNLGLIGINIVIDLGYLHRIEILEQQLNLNDECNLAVWASSAQLLAASLAALVIAWVVPAPHITRFQRFVWVAIALMIMAISADEVSQVHEWTGDRHAAYLGPDDRVSQVLGIEGPYRWLVALAPLIILGALGLFYVATRCLRSHKPSMWLALGGACLWVIVIIAEWYQGRFMPTVTGEERAVQSLIEEGSELLGGGLFLIAFLDFFRVRAPDGIRVNPSSPNSPE